jgi:sulfatase maturation enzyme AslB (radical SAM superfamily)
MILTFRNRRAFFDPSTYAFYSLASPDLDPSAEKREALPAPLSTASVEANMDAAAISQRIRGFTSSRKVLERLVLNVANYCNLNCGYCYAEGGDYGGPHERMSPDVGRQAMRNFLELYDEVATIQFFGGEPLLNWRLIRELCEYGWNLADHLGRKRPIYTLITNGTVLSEEIIELILTFDIKVTVSLDGPPQITNRLRPSRLGGIPTGAVVEAHVRELKRRTDQPRQIEATFTNLHLAENVSVVDLLDYINDCLGITLLHMPLNVLPSTRAGARTDSHAISSGDLPAAADAYADAVANTITSLSTRPLGSYAVLSSALEIIEDLLMPPVGERPVICPAGSGTIAVDSNGDVYPCFMFYRRQQFRLGHIAMTPRSQERPRSRSLPVLEGPVLDKEKQFAFVSRLARPREPLVATSWARRFFTGCAGSNFFKQEDHGVISPGEVTFVEQLACAAVVQLAHLAQEDPDTLRFLPSAIQLFKAHLNAPMLA